MAAQQGFMVQPQVLKDSANKLVTKKTNYDTAIKNIYDIVKTSKTTWQGQSSMTFNKELEAYYPDFQALSKVTSDYIEFLNKAAGEYTGTDERLSGAVPKGRR